MSILTIGDIGVTSGIIHIGDEAMFEAARDELAARGRTMTGISSAPEESAHRYGIDAIGRLGFGDLDRAAAEERSSLLRTAASGASVLDDADPARPVLRVLDGASGVLIAGGGNLASRWPVHVYERTTLAAMAVARGLPVVVTGQTFGPDLTPADESRVAAMARAARLTGVREHDSGARAQQSWGVRARVGVDDASFLAGGPSGGPAAETDAPVLVSLSGWFAGRPAADVEQGIAELLDAAAQTVGPIVFHAHFGPVDAGAEPQGDAALHERVRARMRQDSAVVPSGDSRTAAELARGARLLITSRYHPAVFAAPAGVPILALAADEYTRIKLGGALGHWGQSEVVDLDDLAGAPATLAGLDAARDAIAERALSRLPAHRARAALWWDDVAAALG